MFLRRGEIYGSYFMALSEKPERIRAVYIVNVNRFTASAGKKYDPGASRIPETLLGRGIMSQTATLEHTSIVTYSLLRELHHALAHPHDADDAVLGIIMGTAMFCDETIGPFRTARLMREAPGIVLKADAHVTDEAAALAAPILRAFCRHMEEVCQTRRIPLLNPG
jgi:hypothetical protein